MNKVAIDIVLSLPEAIIELCIKLNKNSNSYGELGFNDYIPHISLSMGLVDFKAFEEIKKELFILKNSFNMILIRAEKIIYLEKLGVKKAWIKINVLEDLQKLHETVTKIMGKYYLEEKVFEKYFFEGRKTGISESTKKIILNHSKNYSFENYSPHITLLSHDAKYDDLPFYFNCETLSVFQLGNNGSCRKKLFEVNLDG